MLGDLDDIQIVRTVRPEVATALQDPPQASSSFAAASTLIPAIKSSSDKRSTRSTNCAPFLSSQSQLLQEKPLGKHWHTNKLIQDGIARRELGKNRILRVSGTKGGSVGRSGGGSPANRTGSAASVSKPGIEVVVIQLNGYPAPSPQCQTVTLTLPP